MQQFNVQFTLNPNFAGILANVKVLLRARLSLEKRLTNRNIKV